VASCLCGEQVKMKIRSITYFINPGWPLDENKLKSAGRFLSEAKSAFETAGYEVQTRRLATIPFPQLLNNKIEEAPRLAEAIQQLMPSIEVEYAALGPAYPDLPSSYEIIPEAIAHTQNIFFSGVMADGHYGISLQAVRACAQVIFQCAPITPDGFANLRFAALANVLPGAPFFPAAYHQGDGPAFSIATEAADLAVKAFRDAKSINEGRDSLVAMLEEHGKTLASIAKQLQSRFGAQFGGVDFSLAPFPTDEQSMGKAVEGMGVPKIGLHGSLAAASILTEAIDRANFQHTGFSGFFQPVLEDSVLAKRAAEGTLTVKDLLLYSAVCGTGLDTVPLPGDVSADQIAALLLDLSALALRLDKPLTARLMPIPGKKAGDETNFDFAFFANSKVMRLDSAELNPPFNQKDVLQIKKR
jgi:uncharacterized protein (UPF0210 family)